MRHAPTSPGLVQGRRAPRSRHPQSHVRVAGIVAIFVALLAAEWLFLHDHIFRSVSVPADPFSGVGLIQLAPDGQGGCERLALNNRSGSITPDGVARCDDILTAPPPGRSLSSPDGGATMSGAAEPHHRLHWVRRHFNPR